MKWMSLFLLGIALNTHAAKQFTEAECILLKHQLSDYSHRLGINSSLYQQTKDDVSNFCKSPIISVKKRNVVLTGPSQSVDFQISFDSIQSRKYIVNPMAPQKSEPLQIILKAFSFSWPIWLIVLMLSMLRLPFVKGKLGEFYVSVGLRKKLPKDMYHIINDITLPLGDGGTTQVDHVAVSPFGIFVIETKNMKGWIFGSEKQATWTQTIYRTKHAFQNPLRQNYKHTQTLVELLDMPASLFHSVIIFTPRAEIKTKMPANVGHLNQATTFIKSFNQELLDNAAQKNVIASIEELRLERGIRTNKRHVEYLKSKHR